MDPQEGIRASDGPEGPREKLGRGYAHREKAKYEPVKKQGASFLRFRAERVYHPAYRDEAQGEKAVGVDHRNGSAQNAGADRVFSFSLSEYGDIKQIHYCKKRAPAEQSRSLRDNHVTDDIYPSHTLVCEICRSEIETVHQLGEAVVPVQEVYNA